MWLLFAFAAVLTVAALAYRRAVLRRFDADPEQQRLSALLVDVAQGTGRAGQADIAALLDRVGTSPANRRARVVHAVLMARRSVPPQVYARVVELSRQIR